MKIKRIYNNIINQQVKSFYKTFCVRKENINLNIQNTKEENVIIVDSNDNITSITTRKKMREENLIHRSTNIIVYNPNLDNYLIQKRSLTKEYFPGFYEIGCGGVVCENETPNSNALKEIKEELGIEINDKTIYEFEYSNNFKHNNKLVFLGKLFRNGVISREWQYVYYLNYAGKCFINDGEVEEINYLNIDEILNKIKSKENITEDSIQAFLLYLKIKERVII